MVIAPITLLVGQNSSGKSTVARFFPLFRQSAEALTREPLLWFGRFVDFGSADTAKSKFAQVGTFGVDFEFGVDRGALSRRRRSLASRALTSEVEVVRVATRYLSRESGTRRLGAYSFTLGFLGHEISLDIHDGQVSKLRINGSDYSATVDNQKWEVPTWSSCFPNLSVAGEGGVQSDGAAAFVRLLGSYVRGHTHGKSQSERVDRLTRSLLNSPLDDMLRALKSPYGGDSMWQKTTAFWTESSSDFQRLRDWVIAARAAELIQSVASAFAQHCRKFRYIAPIRASAERYYRRQGLALGEIDPQGQNVAMFLHNLSANDRSRFLEWMRHSFDFAVDTEISEGHTSMVIGDADGELSFNLADTGFGFSQMLPILIQMWMLSEAAHPMSVGRAVQIVSLEQPELHLHPRLQARLADLLMRAVVVARKNTIDLRIVVETHSEQIINRIGKRISESFIERDWVSLLLFDKKKFSDPTVVRQTCYDGEGLIEAWPYGFFEPESQ